MPIISPRSLNNVEEFPEVEVLLATFNGGLYLSEFLSSLVGQVGVKVHLRVSDDGSVDNTMEILAKFNTSFESFKISAGPKKGPAANFFSLLRSSTLNYVAFADQDDIWSSDHLVNSIKELSELGNIPGMRFTSTKEFGRGVKERIWPRIKLVPEIEKLLMENQARGCTIALNKEAVNVINSYQPKLAVMHDWWILLLLSLNGAVVYQAKPEVQYRIHDTNAVGLSRKRRIRALKSVRSGTWGPMLQARELFELNKYNACTDSILKLKSFIDLPGLKFTKKIRLTLLRSKRLRTNLLDEFQVRVALLLFKPPNQESDAPYLIS
jgi:glycosyltransferase involved in cell wall biosynthesis